jgi:eukaryotic-like serine/threonine-protein kinase
MASAARSPSVVRFGPFEVDTANRELRKSGILLRIHPQPFRVLLLLLKEPGKIVTREEIQDCLWNGNTLVDSDGGINFCVRQIRVTLGDDAERPKYVETLPRQGYRFVAPVSPGMSRDQVIGFASLLEVRSAEHRLDSSCHLPVRESLASAAVPALPIRPVAAPASIKAWEAGLARAVGAALCVVALFAAGAVLYMQRAPKLSEKDALVLADFNNKTGDAVFDSALKQALAVELEQSPFLNLVPDKTTGETLRMMGRSPADRMTTDVAQEVCVRTGSKAFLSGTISKLGTHFLLNLNATACSSGDVLASEQGEAAKKEDILPALSRAAVRMREKLGESLPSVQKYEVPIQATTVSLEALQSLSMAARIGATEGDAASLPFVERALEYDPKFAMAYVALARRYTNLDEPLLAFENSAKAYQLRDRVTERENLQISAAYFRATGDLENLNKTLELWKAYYPRASGPHGRLCANYEFIGQYEKALAECQEAMRLDPTDAVNYGNLAAVYLNLNRYDDSQRTCDQASSRHLSCAVAYDLAFLRGDSAGMRKELSAATGRPGEEDALLCAQSNTAAFHGQLRQARDFSQRATASALRYGLKEAASLWRVNAALQEEELGESTAAKRGVVDALQMAPNRNVKVLGAVALARIGETVQARKLVKELEQSDPDNTLLKIYWLPVINGAIELKRGNTSNAFIILESAAPYELAQPSPNEIGTLYPVYLRGQAYLVAHDGTAAAEEFQTILDHPGIVTNFVTGALAHLGLARAYSLQGRRDKARVAYQEFFALWKNADADIPVLKQAKVEYAKLH